MRTLIFNSNNVVSNTNNSVYRFNFPVSVKIDQEKIAVQSITFPYSMQNLNKELYNNTTITIIYNNQTTIITLPNGFYLINDISNYIQQQCLLSSNNLPYQQNNNGQNSFFFEFVYNTTYYSIQMNIYPVVLKSGFSNPKGAVFNGYCPQIYINSNISKILGLNQLTYPTSSTQNTLYTIMSYQQNNIPIATPINNILISSNIINNNYDVASKTLFSFSPNTTYGSNIIISQSAYAFINCKSGIYDYLEISFSDQNYNKMDIRDPNICIQLLIKSHDE